MGFDWSAITVLEMANVLAGPSVGSFFAQLGARVIKVESANGDVTRTWKLATEDPNNDRPSYFSWINAGKESVVFDYSSDQDKSILQNIIAQSDLVISSKYGSDHGSDDLNILSENELELSSTFQQY